MWTVVAIIITVCVVLFFALLCVAGTLDPNPRESKPPSRPHPSR